MIRRLQVSLLLLLSGGCATARPKPQYPAENRYWGCRSIKDGSIRAQCLHYYGCHGNMTPRQCVRRIKKGDKTNPDFAFRYAAPAGIPAPPPPAPPAAAAPPAPPPAPFRSREQELAEMNTPEARAGFCKRHGYGANLCLEMFGCASKNYGDMPRCFDLRKKVGAGGDPDEERADQWMKACMRQPAPQRTTKCSKFSECYGGNSKKSEGDCLETAGIITLFDVAGWDFDFDED